MFEIALVAAAVVVGLLLLLALLRAVFGRVTVFEYQAGLRFQDGRFRGLVGPGRYWVYRPSTVFTVVDVRQSALSVPGQEVVTSDGMSVKLSLVATIRVADPVKAHNEVERYHATLYGILQVALREAATGLTIDELLQAREALGADVLARSRERAGAIGVEVIGVDVKDLMFPGPLKKVFAQVVEARQQGLASLERARGETAALRSLANAARMVDSSPALLQLRLIQQLEKPGNTIVVGMPAGSTPLPVGRAEPGGRGEPTPELEPGEGTG